MYVARYTFNPQYDATRNWSGYQEPTAKKLETLVEMLIEYGWVKLSARLENAYWEEGVEAVQDYVLDNVDIRFHEAAGVWCVCHHEGLSCWRLRSETLAEAIEEARQLDEAGAIQWGSFGDVTVGAVRYVASVSETLHIFECEGVEKENDM